MCQVLRGELSFVDPHFDLFVDFDEGEFERIVAAAQSREHGGQAWPQDAIVGASEEERYAEAEFGDPIAEAVGQAFDQAVEAQAANLIGNSSLSERFWIAAAQGGKVVAQIGAAEALCELPKQDQRLQERVHPRVAKAQA